MILSQTRQRNALHYLAARFIERRLEHAVLDPAPHRVVAHAEEHCGISNPYLRHKAQFSSSYAPRVALDSVADALIWREST